MDGKERGKSNQPKDGMTTSEGDNVGDCLLEKSLRKKRGRWSKYRNGNRVREKSSGLKVINGRELIMGAGRLLTEEREGKK